MKTNPLSHTNSNRGGPKIISNGEWNDLNNALAQSSVGYNSNMFNEGGYHIPSDDKFCPHNGTINEQNQSQIVIGIDREQEWYPTTDWIGIICNTWLITFKKRNGIWRATSYQKQDDEGYKLPFLSGADYHTPVVPGDIYTNHTLVQYQYHLNWQAVAVSFDGDSASVIIGNFPWDFLSTTKPTADENINVTSVEYSDEIFQGNLFSVVQLDTDDFFSAALSATAIAENWPMYDLSGYVDIGAVYFREKTGGGTEIESWTQLLLENPWVGGGGGGGTAPNDDFRHPFKGQISGDYIAIAPDRADAGYEFVDTITIVDPDTDYALDIEYPEGEYIQISEDSWVYYELYKNGSQWESTLKTSTTWPPGETFAGLLYKDVGYAKWDPTSGIVSGWGQHMYDCPIEHAPDIRGEFEPWYELSGYVTIAAGTVASFYTTQSIAESSWPLDTATDLWVNITSTASTDEPTVAIASSLVSGSFPGNHIDNGSTTDFNYLIGTIENGAYTPKHKGKLNIDTTLLEPYFEANYSKDLNSPRAIAIWDSYPSTVGDSGNTKLLDSQPFQIQVDGGTIRSMENETNTMIWYGLDQDQTGVELLPYQGTDGADWGEGSLAVSAMLLDKTWDRGLVQTHSIYSGNTLTFAAGDNVRIDWAANTATINAQGFTTVSATVVTDVRLNSDGTFDKKTKTIEVINQSAESGWTSAGSLATTTCP